MQIADMELRLNNLLLCTPDEGIERNHLKIAHEQIEFARKYPTQMAERLLFVNSIVRRNEEVHTPALP
jgi:hypothetical protein